MVAGSRSRTRAEAAAEKRTTRSAAAAAGQNSENVNAIPKAATLAGSSKSASAKHQAPGKKSQSPTKPKSSSTATSVAVSVLRKSTSKDVEGEVFCSCKGRDDGSPMIKCDGECNMWYHLRCIDISEEDAGEIDAYFCPNCEAKLGVKTVSKCAPSVKFSYHFYPISLLLLLRVGACTSAVCYVSLDPFECHDPTVLISFEFPSWPRSSSSKCDLREESNDRVACSMSSRVGLLCQWRSSSIRSDS